MVQRTELSSGRIGDDALRVDLIRITQDSPLVVVVRWSGGSQSQVSPPRFADFCANACRILAAASTALARRRLDRKDA